ncbi:MAG: N-acetylmuramoyl-L-alanine amidase [Bacteroidia bacterium]
MKQAKKVFLYQMRKVKLKIVLLCCTLLSLLALGQQQRVKSRLFYQQRFDNYLNLKNNLSPLVKIGEEGVELFKDAASGKAGKAEIFISWNEVELFRELLKTQPGDTVEALLRKKGTSKWGPQLLKPYLPAKTVPAVLPADPLTAMPLRGLKIAIDPGHIAGNMDMARIEQKYIHFCKDSFPSLLQDSIDIAEGTLTFQTSCILKKMLEEQAAVVMLTRNENSTAFGVNYGEWLKTRKKTVLDSLKAIGEIAPARYKQLMKLDEKKFFWEFFKDAELAQRIRKINTFQPDLTIIVHYNVDEKNKDWTRPSKVNYTMAFIGGAMTRDSFGKMRGKVAFLRLLLSDDLSESERLAALTVEQFNKQLGVSIAKQNDADYLRDNCISSPSPGVFCRNLALCRMVNSPLVYGECLFQDNLEEMYTLCRQDKTYYGIVSNERVYKVAASYFEAIKQYCKK